VPPSRALWLRSLLDGWADLPLGAAVPCQLFCSASGLMRWPWTCAHLPRHEHMPLPHHLRGSPQLLWPRVHTHTHTHRRLGYIPARGYPSLRSRAEQERECIAFCVVHAGAQGERWSWTYCLSAAWEPAPAGLTGAVFTTAIVFELASVVGLVVRSMSGTLQFWIRIQALQCRDCVGVR
jgi:hypothetical protein